MAIRFYGSRTKLYSVEMEGHSILYILVLYHVAAEHSIAYQGLRQYLSAEEYNDIYIHDNTPHNVYLAEAYNRGLEYAILHRYKWIVLLDADTAVSEEYVRTLKAAIAEDATSVCVPVLVDSKGKQLSPSKLYGKPTAFNSGLAVRCEIMEQIGGFNRNYPLDYLDNWLCRELYIRHINLTVLPVRLLHNLSVNDPKHYVSKERYNSILHGERQFAEQYNEVIRYKMRLLCRLCKWILTGHPCIKETFRALI